jgi:hypothetical protein
MKSDYKPVDGERRRFLSGAAAAGVGSVVAAAVPGSALAGAEQQPDEAGSGKGYQLSQHVLDYYKSAAS